MVDKPSHPWRFDTNERYREVVRLVMGLSTASLLLPIFFAREFLSIEDTVALKDVFSKSVYSSWFFLAFSILSCIKFHFLSAKWVRLAWGKPASIFCISVSEGTIEKFLNITFWACIVAFVLGVGSIMIFLVSYAPGS